MFWGQNLGTCNMKKHMFSCSEHGSVRTHQHWSFEIVFVSSKFESRVGKVCWKLGEFEWSSSQNSSLTRVFQLFFKISGQFSAAFVLKNGHKPEKKGNPWGWA